jgi:hypothetical protein
VGVVYPYGILFVHMWGLYTLMGFYLYIFGGCIPLWDFICTYVGLYTLMGFYLYICGGCIPLWDFMGSYSVKKLFKLLPGFMT